MNQGREQNFAFVMISKRLKKNPKIKNCNYFNLMFKDLKNHDGTNHTVYVT